MFYSFHYLLRLLNSLFILLFINFAMYTAIYTFYHLLIPSAHNISNQESETEMQQHLQSLSPPPPPGCQRVELSTNRRYGTCRGRAIFVLFPDCLRFLHLYRDVVASSIASIVARTFSLPRNLGYTMSLRFRTTVTPTSVWLRAQSWKTKCDQFLSIYWSNFQTSIFNTLLKGSFL